MLSEDDVLKERSDAYNCRQRKKSVARAIALAKQTTNASVIVENELEIDMPCWTSKMMDEFPDLF